MVHFKSKAFDRTILKIYTTRQQRVKEHRDSEHHLLNIDTVTCAAKDKTGAHGFCKPPCLVANLFLIFSGKVDEVVVLGANQEGNSCLVEAATLSVPLLYAVESRLPCEIEHEENGDGIVADQWKHVDELSLPTKIPYREGDLGVTD